MLSICKLIGHNYKVVATKKFEMKLTQIDSVRTVEIVRACTRCSDAINTEIRLKANSLLS